MPAPEPPSDKTQSLLPRAKGYRPPPHHFDCVMDRATHVIHHLDARLVVDLLPAVEALMRGGYPSYTTLVDHVLGQVAVYIRKLQSADLAAVLVACAKAGYLWGDVTPDSQEHVIRSTLASHV